MSRSELHQPPAHVDLDALFVFVIYFRCHIRFSICPSYLAFDTFELLQKKKKKKKKNPDKPFLNF